MGKPNKLMEKPKKLMEKPKKLMEKPKKLMEKPKKLIEKPKKLMEKPNKLMEKPNKEVLKILCKPQISRCIDYFKHLNTDGGFSWQKKNMATQHFEHLLKSVVSKTYNGLTNCSRI